MKSILPITITLALTLFTGTAPAVEAEALWGKHCAACHGKDGSGNTRMGKKVNAKDYRDPKVQEAMKDDAALKSLKEGIKEDGKERMKPLTDKLNEEEMKALIAYMRTFKK